MNATMTAKVARPAADRARLRMRGREVREIARRLVRRSRGAVSEAEARAVAEASILGSSRNSDPLTSRRAGWVRFDFRRAPHYTRKFMREDVAASRAAGPLPLP